MKNRVKPLSPMHVADGVDVDQESDAGDDQQHDAAERIDQIGEIDGQIAAEDPLIGDDFCALARSEWCARTRRWSRETTILPIPSQPVRDVVRISLAEKTIHEHGQSAETAESAIRCTSNTCHATTISKDSFHRRWWRSFLGTRQ